MTSSSASRTRFSVPASSANLGPGFDCLGLALDLRLLVNADWSTDTVRLNDFDSPLAWWRKCVKPFCTYTGTLADFEDEQDQRPNLFAVAFLKAVVSAGPNFVLPAQLQARIHSDIPVGQGLGSSAAAVVAGAAIAQAWRNDDGGLAALFRTAVEIEGHADNAAAAVYGGLQAALLLGSHTRARPLPVHESLQVAMCVPQKTLKESTTATRRSLPEQLRLTEAVSNQRSLLTLLYGLEAADGHAISAGLEDRLHVPHRKAMIAGYEEIVSAARKAGAFGATISGAGGSMIAFGQGNMQNVAEAMQDEYRRHGVEAAAITPRIASVGITYLRA